MIPILLALTAPVEAEPIASPPPVTMCGDTSRLDGNIVSRLDFNLYGRVEWSVIEFPDHPGTDARPQLIDQARGRYDESRTQLYMVFNDGSYESCKIVGRLLNGIVGAIQCNERRFSAALCE